MCSHLPTCPPISYRIPRCLVQLAKLNGYTLYDLPADMKAVAEEVQASIRLPKHEAAAAAAGAAATA